MSKTIGILGGMGSFATLHFFKALLELSEPDEFRIVIDNAVHILERTKAVREKREVEVVEGIIRSLLDLSKVKADFVVVPCNQAHHWHSCIAKMFKMPWLNMIEIVSDTVTKGGYSSPLILGGYVTVTKKLYSEYLPGAVYLDEGHDKKVYEWIRDIKRGEKSVVYQVIPDTPQKHDSIILACTELSIAKDKINSFEIPIIDSSLELAKATIKYARGE